MMQELGKSVRLLCQKKKEDHGPMFQMWQRHFLRAPGKCVPQICKNGLRRLESSKCIVYNL